MILKYHKRFHQTYTPLTCRCLQPRTLQWIHVLQKLCVSHVLLAIMVFFDILRLECFPIWILPGDERFYNTSCMNFVRAVTGHDDNCDMGKTFVIGKSKLSSQFYLPFATYCIYFSYNYHFFYNYIQILTI